MNEEDSAVMFAIALIFNCLGWISFLSYDKPGLALVFFGACVAIALLSQIEEFKR